MKSNFFTKYLGLNIKGAFVLEIILIITNREDNTF